MLLVLSCLLLLSIPSNAVILAWDANSEEDLAGYRLHYGYESGVYGITIDVGNVTTYEVTGLAVDQDYYFVLTAYDTEDLESDYSNEVLREGEDQPPVYLGATLWVASMFQIPEEEPPIGDRLKMGKDYHEIILPDGSMLTIFPFLNSF